jgi:uncharacterized protein YjbI with pentapeptide repeats
MANKAHLDMLAQGREVWNAWRRTHPEIRPDLRRVSFDPGYDLVAHDFRDADLTEAGLDQVNLAMAQLQGARLHRAHADATCFRGAVCHGANMSEAEMGRADFSDAWLNRADLRAATLVEARLGKASLVEADLRHARLMRADLREAELEGADLREAVLFLATLGGANLRNANLEGASLKGTDLRHAKLGGACLREALLEHAVLSNADLSHADLSRASVYGAAAWSVRLDGATQCDLRITPDGECAITVDSIEVAQFIYLLRSNPRIRSVIDAITAKAVLILGRFSAERKAVLDTLRTALSQSGFVPIIFDFDRPASKDFSETIMTLAGLSLFVVADITNPKSSPLELQATVPNCMTPFVTIIQDGEEPFAMFADLRGRYDWVLEPLCYDSASGLVAAMEQAIIAPALDMRARLMERKGRNLRTRHVRDYS